MSIREQQVESVLKRSISWVLQQKLSDPRVQGIVTVTRVDVSPDLRQAAVYVSVLPAKLESCTIHGLRSASPHIHKLISRRVTIKTMPQLDFRLDQSLKKQAAIFAAIQEGIEREERDL